MSLVSAPLSSASHLYLLLPLILTLQVHCQVLPHSTMSSSSYEYKQYFVSSWLISRHIIFSHIQFYLGPYASVRPYSYRGREGYLVTAPGAPLTRVRFALSILKYSFYSVSRISLVKNFHLSRNSWQPSANLLPQCGIFRTLYTPTP